MMDQMEKNDFSEIFLGMEKGLHHYKNLLALNEQQNVLVIREPKDRFLAGYSMVNHMKSKDKFSEKTEESYFYSFKRHAGPIYYNFVPLKLNYKIIRFEDISNYFDAHEGVNDFKKRNTRWLKKYDKCFNHWEEELEAYDTILNTREIIDPEEFKALVKFSKYVNMKGVSNLRYKRFPEKLVPTVIDI